MVARDGSSGRFVGRVEAKTVSVSMSKVRAEIVIASVQEVEKASAMEGTKPFVALGIVTPKLAAGVDSTSPPCRNCCLYPDENSV